MILKLDSRALVPFYFVRTPLLSIDKLLSSLTEGKLVNLINEPIIGEALQMASPLFHAQIKKDPKLTNSSIRVSALKYIIRLGSRCTPFGRFAGYSLGQPATLTDLDMSNRELENHYLLDMNVIFSLCRFLEKDATVLPHIKFFPNNSLYLSNNNYSYIETKYYDGKSDFFVSELVFSSALNAVVKRAERGATIEELVCQLVREKYTQNDAINFVYQLIDDQVIVSELHPSVTGQNQLSNWLSLITKMPSSSNICQMLVNIDNLLKPSTDIGSPETEIRSILNEFNIKTPIDRSVIHCTSAFINASTRINATVFDKLGHIFSDLMILSSAFEQSRPSALALFKKTFYDRYEEREIPLITALDISLGIGYGQHLHVADSSIIEDILIEAAQYSPSEIQLSTQQWLLKLYTRWQEQPDHTLPLYLNLEDILQVKTDSKVSKGSYHALGYFLAVSSMAVDKGHYQFVLKGLGGSLPLNLMGRFCQQDEQLTEQIKSQLSAFQQDDEHHVYAEVAHCPSIQAGNVVRRPHLSEYEIPLLTHSSLPSDKQILLSDLWVSVPGGQRVVLRSGQLNKEVVPRLTTAHDYRAGLPVYQFLCDLQQQNAIPSLSWQWGWLDQVRHLPRVQYKQVIIKEARWRLRVSDINPALSNNQNLANWRLQWNIPRLVALEHVDQSLLLDLDQSDCQGLLFDSLKRLASIYIIEWLRTPEQCCIIGPEGRLAHEVIIPFIRKYSYEHKPLSASATQQSERTFLPGSQWFYLKIYVSPALSSEVINRLGQIGRKLIRNNLISHWFFIRYADPAHHLRFRCHMHDPSSIYLLLRKCQDALEPLLKNESILKLQLDTYCRELERYGERKIEVTERIFWLDSDTIYQLHIIANRNEEPITQAILGVHAYLADFSMSLSDKLVFCKRVFKNMLAENESSPTLKKKLDVKYRLNKDSIVRLLQEVDMTVAERAFKNVFRKRSKRMSIYINTHSENFFSNQYITSIIHLFINRLFIENHKIYELLIYHHLMKTYQSLVSRAENEVL